MNFKKLILSLSVLAILNTTTNANDNITLDWLNNQPKSIAKDFYIWQYLGQNITAKEAQNAISQTSRFNNKLFSRFIAKYNNKDLKNYRKCQREKTKTLLQKEAYCIEAGLSVYDATKLSKNKLDTLIKKVEPQYKGLAKKLEILESPLPFRSLELADDDTFFNVFNQVGSYYRAKNFNQYFNLDTLQRLKQDKRFAQTIKLIVTNSKMKKAQLSLLNLSPDGFGYKSLFHLAINAIINHKEKKALEYLEVAYHKAYYQMQKDNIVFWQYQLTKDKKYLYTLAKSWDLNIYSLYAQDKVNSNNTKIVYNIEQPSNYKSNYDETVPFNWLKVLKDSKHMDKKKLSKYNKLFNTPNTLGHLAFIKERYDRYKTSYFITPYNKYLKKLPKDKQALVYAIARQESRFIPTSISPAYAMGLMQIMPFLSKAISKELHLKYDIYQQLNPKTNLKYAVHHLKFLEKRLHHPLFIAYGYNGGIGFTKRLFKKGLFKKGKYEPYLSMELLPYDETKKYGKKVLANYFIYQNYLNKDHKIKFSKLMDIDL